METHHAHRGSLVGPVVLIGAGIVFLLNNMGLLSWNIWEVLLRLWPVLLIAAGLDILIGRRSVAGSLFVVIILLGVLGFAIWLARPGPGVATAQGLSTQQISQSLEGATKAVVDISPGVGELRIAAGQESAGLVQGSVALGPNERLTHDFSRSGEIAYYTLHSDGFSPMWWPGPLGSSQWTGRIWDLQMSRDVPLDLKIDTGVGKASLDLSRLNITNLRVNSGVGQTLVTLPHLGKLTANVDAGVGEVLITIPVGMAASIRVDGGLGKTSVEGNYQHIGDEYVSPNYDTAENRVELRINGGVGNVTVQEQRGG